MILNYIFLNYLEKANHIDMFGLWARQQLSDSASSPVYRTLRCFSFGLFPLGDKTQHERGDKILLPASLLAALNRRNVKFPMLFKLECNQCVTHCGVLEFSAPEGHMYIPFWMMGNLCVREGQSVRITNISLPKATFVKIQPVEHQFLKLSNPKAVLEHELRHFTCLTQGDQITIKYDTNQYNIQIKEIWPEAACCILETDCNVEFEVPPGYSAPEPSVAPPPIPPKTSVSAPKQEIPRLGGRRVDGKTVSSSMAPSQKVVQGRRKRLAKFSKLNNERFAGKGHSLH
jgi:ubiquitin fusion degradation protein 1